MSPPGDPGRADDDLSRQRVPLSRRVSLKFKEFRGFITEYSSNISLGGMFIRSEAPKPPGTVFDFELGLTDDFTLVQGIATVVWVRHHSSGDHKPAGMGIRFLDLSPQSRELIQKVVEEHVRSGGTPFDLDAEAPGVLEARPSAGPAIAPERRGSPPPPPARPSVPPDWRLGTGTLAPGKITWAPEHAEGGGRRATATTATGPAIEPREREAASPRAMGRPPAPAPAERLPAGFDEVTRAFGSAESGEAGSPPVGAQTVPHSKRSATAASDSRPISEPRRPEPAPRPHRRVEPWDHSLEGLARPGVAADLRYGSPRKPRRRRHPLLVVLAVLLVAGALASAYLAFPGLLGPWFPFRDPAAMESPAVVPPVVEPAAPASPPAPSRTVGVFEEGAEPAVAESRAATRGVELGLPASTGEEHLATGSVPISPARLTRLEEVRWQRRGAGTLVVLVADGGFHEGSYSHFRLGGEVPRAVIRIRGVQHPFGRPSLAVQSPQVGQVRTGLHPGNELHVVLDLAGPGVDLERVEAQGTSLLLYLTGP
jgi:type IV pilus assembly protein PilZ